MSKVTQRTARVRFTDFRDHQIDINLRIYTRGQKWDMDISARGQSRTRIPVNIKNKYLLELNQRLRNAAGKAMHHAQIGGRVAQEEYEADLKALAQEGNLAFNEIFSQTEAREMMEKFFRSDKNITIEINAEDFSIPWELLYSASLEKPAYKNFWGMKYIVSRIINQDDRPGDIESTTIEVQSKPKLGLFALKTNNLPSISTKEIPFFQKLKKAGKISLRVLPGLDPTPANKDSEVNRFKQFFNEPYDVAHFACHAHYDEQKSLESFIQLSKGIRISLFDLAQQPPVAIKDFPLVVLNACKMGAINPMDVRYFAGDFIKYGALGVVATEAAVPDNLAADFTRHLYKHLLNEKYLGESVLLARNELLQRGNPIGLLYALYAPPVIRFQLPKAKKKAAANNRT